MENEYDQTPDSVDFLDAHLDKFFESKDISVYHELVSDFIHCDIYLIKPNAMRPYNLLLSGGMSSLPMKVPQEMQHLQYAEVMCLLPADWKLGQKDFENEANYWPIRTLKRLARFPHEADTWLGWGHTIPFWENNDDDGGGHGFAGVMLIDSITLPEEFSTIDENGKAAFIYSVIPLYQEEMDYKLEHGADELLAKFDAADIDEIYTVGRVNVCL